MRSTIRVHTLGRFVVERDGVAIPGSEWGAHREKTLLKVLLATPSRALSRERLIESIWPHLPASRASAALNVAVSGLRRVLEPEANGGEPRKVLLTVPYGYALAGPPGISIDLDAFDEGLRLGGGTPGAEVERYRLAAALELYRGDFLPDDLYEDWSMPMRDDHRARFIAAAERLAREHLRLGSQEDLVTAVHWLRRALAADPLAETAAASLIDTYGRLGERANAQRVHERLRRALALELEVVPLPETDRVLRTALAGTGDGREAAGAAGAQVPGARLRATASRSTATDRSIDNSTGSDRAPADHAEAWTDDRARRPGLPPALGAVLAASSDRRFRVAAAVALAPAVLIAVSPGMGLVLPSVSGHATWMLVLPGGTPALAARAVLGVLAILAFAWAGVVFAAAVGARAPGYGAIGGALRFAGWGGILVAHLVAVAAMGPEARQSTPSNDFAEAYNALALVLAHAASASGVVLLWVSSWVLALGMSRPSGWRYRHAAAGVLFVSSSSWSVAAVVVMSTPDAAAVLVVGSLAFAVETLTVAAAIVGLPD